MIKQSLILGHNGQYRFTPTGATINPFAKEVKSCVSYSEMGW